MHNKLKERGKGLKQNTRARRLLMGHNWHPTLSTPEWTGLTNDPAPIPVDEFPWDLPNDPE